MRILVIAELFPPDMGGGSTRAFNVVKGLVSLGHKVTVVTAFPHYPTGNTKEYRRKVPLPKRELIRLLGIWDEDLYEIYEAWKA